MREPVDDLVATYLAELDRELSDLPRARRRELVAEIEEHIADARAALSDETEAAVRGILERVGDPAEIAAEARERLGLRRARPGWREVGALVLLPIGGVVLPLVGWVVGVVCLWLSNAWTTRDKILGTAIVPGGLLVPAYLALAPAWNETCSQTGSFDPVTGASVPGPIVCTGGPSEAVEILWLVFSVALVVAPVAMVIYLGLRLRQRAEPAAA